MALDPSGFEGAAAERLEGLVRGASPKALPLDGLEGDALRLGSAVNRLIEFQEGSFAGFRHDGRGSRDEGSRVARTDRGTPGTQPHQGRVRRHGRARPAQPAGGRRDVRLIPARGPAGLSDGERSGVPARHQEPGTFHAQSHQRPARCHADRIRPPRSEGPVGGLGRVRAPQRRPQRLCWPPAAAWRSRSMSPRRSPTRFPSTGIAWSRSSTT